MMPVNAAYEAKKRADAERLAAHNEKLAVWRAENRRRQGLSSIPTNEPTKPRSASPLPFALASAVVPLAPKSATTRLAPPTAADREFDVVAAAAIARIEAAEKLRRDEDALVAAIVAATP